MPRVRYLSSTDSRRASLNLLRSAPCRGAPKGDLRKALSSEIDLSSSVADSKGNPFGAWIRRGDHLKSLARLSRTAAVPRRRRNPFFHHRVVHTRHLPTLSRTESPKRKEQRKCDEAYQYEEAERHGDHHDEIRWLRGEHSPVLPVRLKVASVWRAAPRQMGPG